MSTISSSRSSAPWQNQFLDVLPKIQTHAAIRFRRQRPQHREESVQEAIAAACINYQLLAAKGKLSVARPSTLADFAVRHVRQGRHVGGSQDLRHDLLSPACHRHHGFDLDPLDCSSDGGTGWKCLASGTKSVSIPDLAAFRIDFERWLSMRTKRDRKIIADLASGERAAAVAQRFGLSDGRVCQLRKRYEREWQVFQGEAEVAGKARKATEPPAEPSCSILESNAPARRRALRFSAEHGVNMTGSPDL